MFEFGKKDKETLDAEIKTELEKMYKLSKEDLEQISGGRIEQTFGDTREEYSKDPEDINRSIYGALYDEIP